MYIPVHEINIDNSIANLIYSYVGLQITDENVLTVPEIPIIRGKKLCKNLIFFSSKKPQKKTTLCMIRIQKVTSPTDTDPEH
jgi:hypothetical protein